VSYTSHYSVMNKEVIQNLTEKQTEDSPFLFADGTFGAGGHTFALAQTHPDCKVFCTDQDPDALKNGYAQIKEQSFDEKVFLKKGNFTEFSDLFKEELEGTPGLNGVVMDLGVSSHHFDDSERGFSFRHDGPLDMRMDYKNDEIRTAEDILNSYTVEELEEIFREYGEEKFSKRIAEKIGEERRKEPLKTTKDLENIIFHCYPKKMRFGKTHPSTRCFQALRIEVNQELEVLKLAISNFFGLLAPGGRMAIISFHSLEDRIVKRAYKSFDKGECKILTKKPLIPTQEETGENPRSRSAKLRVLEKIGREKGGKETPLK
jgi:16S rRNA (cytosine1402-N4)-methyltransferase